MQSAASKPRIPFVQMSSPGSAAASAAGRPSRGTSLDRSVSPGLAGSKRSRERSVSAERPRELDQHDARRDSGSEQADRQVQEPTDTEKSTTKRLGWKKVSITKSSAKSAVAADVIETFAKASDQSVVSALYTARKEMEIKPLTKDPDTVRAEVPTDPDALKVFQFSWEVVDRPAFMKGPVQKVIDDRVRDYVGRAEPDLVKFILSHIVAGKSADEVAAEVKAIFGEDTTTFVLKMWSEMVFEYLMLC